MSHIVAITVSGLTGRSESLTLKLDRHVNVFYGANGSGKTSLLKIINAVMCNDPQLLFGVPFQSATVVVASKDYEQEYVYELANPHYPYAIGRDSPTADRDTPSELRHALAMLHSSQDDPRRRHVPVSWTVTPSLASDFGGGWRHGWLPTSRLHHNTPPGARRNAVDEEDAAYEYFIHTLWLKYFGAKQVEAATEQQRCLARILMAAIGKGIFKDLDVEVTDPDRMYAHMISFLKRQSLFQGLPTKEEFESQMATNETMKRIVLLIDEVERKIEDIMRPRTKLEGTITRMFSGPKQLSFTKNRVRVLLSDAVEIGIGSLSSGEKHLLRILLEAVMADETPLLVDEPELSLHVDWQRDLIPALQKLSPTMQLLCATHSPEILANVRDNCIFSLD